MIEQDTIKLLRECDAGVKMAISSIDEVLLYVSDEAQKCIKSGFASNLQTLHIKNSNYYSYCIDISRTFGMTAFSTV